jgi:predicted permease
MSRLADSLTRKLPYPLRALRFNPTFAAAALLTLAIGIGANTAVFSVVHSVLLSPLSYPEPEALVGILTQAPGAPDPSGGSSGIRDLPESASMFLTYADGNRSFESIGIWFPFAATVTGTSEPEQVRTVGVSQGVLEALGVQPRLGRSFGERDYQPGGPETVMITYGYWQRRFGGDSSIVGRTLSIDRPREIIGVMPDGFRVVTADPEIIVPMRQDRSQTYLVPFNFQTVARLKPGVSLAQANADLARLIRVWMGAWSMPPGLGGSGNPFEPWRITPTARPLKQDVVGNVGNVLWVVTGTIGIVLLIACANVANLLLVRAEGRQHELAVRSALGAGWWRIVRELLLESMWLALLGGVLGIVLAYAGVGLLVNTANTALPRLHEISIDLPVLGFALGVSLLSGLLFGLIPAFRYAGARALTASRTASHDRRSHRTRDGLAMVQVALALVMLVGSGLMIRTFQAMRAVDPGFARPEQLQTVRISFPVSVVATPGNVAQLQKEIHQRDANGRDSAEPHFVEPLAIPR